MLENVGQQFCYLIADRFKEKPLLNLSIETIFDAPRQCIGDDGIGCGCDLFGQILSTPGIPVPDIDVGQNV